VLNRWPKVPKQLTQIWKAHPIADRMAHKTREQITCSQEQIRRVNTEYVRVAELEQMLQDQVLELLSVDKITLSDVMQVSEAKKQRCHKDRLPVGQALDQQRQHAPAKDELLGEWANNIVPPEAQVLQVRTGVCEEVA